MAEELSFNSKEELDQYVLDNDIELTGDDVRHEGVSWVLTLEPADTSEEK